MFDDTIPFLRGLRDRGIKIAIVSNCTENTRPLLVKHGVDALADTLVLSCEVGSAKPEAEIFRCALDRLGVAADAAVFVDDQAGYCAGSVAAGIRAVQIVRPASTGRGLNGQGWTGRYRRNHGGPVAAGGRGPVRRVTGVRSPGCGRQRSRPPRLGRMDTGVAIFPTHDAIAPAELARLAEERGHESLFFPEHTHIPASRRDALPGRP